MVAILEFLCTYNTVVTLRGLFLSYSLVRDKWWFAVAAADDSTPP